VTTAQQERLSLGRRVALASTAINVGLAGSNVVVGFLSGSTSVVAAGLHFMGDVLASTVVLIAMFVAGKPADPEHPYGHGRFETVAGLVVGMILLAGGVGICYTSLQRIGEGHPPPSAYGVSTLLLAILVRVVMSTTKFRVGRRIQSSAIVADAWNDAVDILWSSAALVALGLTLYDPSRFLAADHYGGFIVGLVVIFTGFRVIRDTSLELMDTMPDADSLADIKRVALTVPGVLGVEKCFARKTGLQHHVDIHLEVDPEMTVAVSHAVASQARKRLCAELDWIADVLVHIEPAPAPDPSAPAPADPVPPSDDLA